MNNARIWFSKKGRAIYISHLDMIRCIQRAIKRAKIPIWYTEGFNPHAYITFALPLSLGYESDCETMDVKLVEDISFDELKETLNKALPQEIRIERIAAPINKPEVIAYADYKLTVHGADVSEFIPKWQAFISQTQIISKKRTKKGFKEVNLKDYIAGTGVISADGEVVLSLRLIAGINENLNPSLIVTAFQEAEKLQYSHISVLRTAVRDSQLNLFE